MPVLEVLWGPGTVPPSCCSFLPPAPSLGVPDTQWVCDHVSKPRHSGDCSPTTAGTPGLGVFPVSSVPRRGRPVVATSPWVCQFWNFWMNECWEVSCPRSRQVARSRLAGLEPPPPPTHRARVCPTACRCSDHGQCDDGTTGSGRCFCEAGLDRPLLRHPDRSVTGQQPSPESIHVGLAGLSDAWKEREGGCFLAHRGQMVWGCGPRPQEVGR